MKACDQMDVHTLDEATRLLHLALIAQVQAWEAQGNLESLLAGELVCGSEEYAAIHTHLADAIQSMASDPEKSLPALLFGATVDDLLATAVAERQAQRSMSEVQA